ncbi:hypothetical protein [Acetivibrio cellulolyticus]
MACYKALGAIAAILLIISLDLKQLLALFTITNLYAKVIKTV